MDVIKIIVTSLVSILVLFIICRVLGQKQISQMSMFDYVNSITIGSNAAELATDLETWWQPLLAMVIYGLVALLISVTACKSISLRKLFNGKPLVLFEEGKLYKANLMQAHLDINEFLTQCRVAGYFDLSQLEAAVLETNGQISFLPLSENRPTTPKDFDLKPPMESLAVNLILDGNILEENLKYSGKDRAWLQKQLHSQDIGQISDVFLATCDKEGNFTAFRMENEPVQHEIFE